MVRKIFLSVWLVIGLMPLTVKAQSEQLPPAIITFESDVKETFIPAVELHTVETRLSWQAVNMQPPYSLRLYEHSLNEWRLLNGFPESGFTTVVLEHPIDFGSPTYRLTIEDGVGTVYDERILTIPFVRIEGVIPEIHNFAVWESGMDINTLTYGQAMITVNWDVQQRAPYSNLIFEQVFSDGSTQLIEMPRDMLWIPSQGTGVVAPVLPPDNANFLLIRLRVIDMRTGETYSQSEVYYPVTGTLIENPAPGQTFPNATATFPPMPPTPTMVVFEATSIPPTYVPSPTPFREYFVMEATRRGNGYYVVPGDCPLVSWSIDTTQHVYLETPDGRQGPFEAIGSVRVGPLTGHRTFKLFVEDTLFSEIYSDSPASTTYPGNQGTPMANCSL